MCAFQWIEMRMRKTYIFFIRLFFVTPNMSSKMEVDELAAATKTVTDAYTSLTPNRASAYSPAKRMRIDECSASMNNITPRFIELEQCNRALKCGHLTCSPFF